MLYISWNNNFTFKLFIHFIHLFLIKINLSK